MCLIFTSCSITNHEHEKEKAIAEILAIHNAQRNNHFNKDALASAKLLSDNYIAVNKGTIKKPTKSEFINKRNGYYNKVRFIKWNDLSPPVIQFSDDYTIAYTIVKKDIVTNYKDLKNGDSIQEQTEFAWVTIYRKEKGEWKIETAISTNKPETRRKIIK